MSEQQDRPLDHVIASLQSASLPPGSHVKITGDDGFSKTPHMRAHAAHIPGIPRNEKEAEDLHGRMTRNLAGQGKAIVSAPTITPPPATLEFAQMPKPTEREAERASALRIKNSGGACL